MKVLVVGSGGREHTLVYKIKQSPKVEKVYCIPGNAGIAMMAECAPANTIEEIVEFVEREDIALTVIGPEAYLAAGLVDLLIKRGRRVFGPTSQAAKIESSKAYSKKIMWKYGIPTAAGKIFNDFSAAVDYLQNGSGPIVVKADGLAAGKGVIVASDRNEALEALRKMMVEKVFGDAGNTVIIEECLQGPEISLLYFVDGEKAVPMVSAQDYKRVFDGQKGPNTGGMGAYSPSKIATKRLQEEVTERVVYPLIRGLKEEGVAYKGVLYVGIMLTKEGPMVLEFNARFGDPETQVILPRLKNDIIDVFNAVIDGRLDRMQLEWDERKAVCVILASGGYPLEYQKGKVISGLDIPGEEIIIHAGTKERNGEIITDGGRVLGVVALGSTYEEAREKAYARAAKIHFEGMHYRKDIGEVN